MIQVAWQEAGGKYSRKWRGLFVVGRHPDLGRAPNLSGPMLAKGRPGCSIARWATPVASRGSLDKCRLPAYTFNMSTERHKPAATPCLCNALRQASRAVNRLYDEELRGVGLRTTQYSLLHVLARAGQVRQGDLSGLASLDETTLTRNLRPLVAAGWVAVRSGDDRREKLVRITPAGTAKLAEARPAWERAQTRMQALLSARAWQGLMTILSEVTRLTAGA
jgi:DNA-binding MarR family transcriptional regulator